MSQAEVVRNSNANIAIQILKDEKQAVMVHRMGGPLEVERFQFLVPEHRRDYETDWKPALDKEGRPYEPSYVAKRFLQGEFSKLHVLTTQVVEALAGIFPTGDHHVFTSQGFFGRFETLEDAQILGKALKDDQLIIFSSPEDLAKMAKARPRTFSLICGFIEAPAIPAKPKAAYFQGVFDMTKKAVAKKAAKVAKAEGAKRRADGPVAKLREMFGKLDLATTEATEKVLAKAEELGINRGTALTQLSRARKERGISMRQAAGAKKDKTPAKKATKKASKSATASSASASEAA